MSPTDPTRLEKRRSRSLTALALALGLALAATPAAADEYHADEAGHPLRVLAYVLHPVGVVIDYLIFRPAHWLGHKEPIKTLVGHTD